MTDLEIKRLERNGWRLNLANGKWWRPEADDGARYVNNARAFRYITEDYGLPEC